MVGQFAWNLAGVNIKHAWFLNFTHTCKLQVQKYRKYSFIFEIEKIGYCAHIGLNFYSQIVQVVFFFRWFNKNKSGVLACSALRKTYRNILCSGKGDGPKEMEDVLFVLLTGDRSALEKRLSDRQNHFMPSALLDSQLATLEIPDDSESSLTLDIESSADELVDQICRHLQTTT